jgi:hypothetical protein
MIDRRLVALSTMFGPALMASERRAKRGADLRSSINSIADTPAFSLATDA